MARAITLWWRFCVDSGIDPLGADAIQFSAFITALKTIPKGLPLVSPVRALPSDPRLRRPTTVSVRVRHVKAFYRWAKDNVGGMSQATAKAIAAVKTPTSASAMTANRATPSQVETFLGLDLHPRNRFSAELLYGAGLREGEALGLQVIDLCITREVAAAYECSVPGWPHLHVRRRLNSNGTLAKSPYARVVPFGPRLLACYHELQAWAYDNAPETVDSAFVLLSLRGPTRGQPWSINGFTSMWDDHVRSAQGLDGLNPHLLRHTYASELVDAGVDRFVIQTLLGHRSPASTQRYTHALMSTLTSAVDRLSLWREATFGLVA
jgi:site-specific recombinase XerD